MTTVEELLIQAEEAGYRLETVGGLGVWEAHPAPTHQREVFRIQRSIRPEAGHESGCECVQLADVYVRFPDGSLKRPDISNFCREPEEAEEAITVLPEAVVEILSRGYEAKDLEVGVPFYMAHGVKDIIVFDPYALRARHFEGGREHLLQSPATIQLHCGCVCVV